MFPLHRSVADRSHVKSRSPVCLESRQVHSLAVGSLSEVMEAGLQETTDVQLPQHGRQPTSYTLHASPALALRAHCTTRHITTATDTHSQTIDTHSQTIDTHSQTIDTHSQIIDTHSQTTDTHSQTIDTHSQTTDTHSQTIDTKPSSPTPSPPTAEQPNLHVNAQIDGFRFQLQSICVQESSVITSPTRNIFMTLNAG